MMKILLVILAAIALSFLFALFVYWKRHWFFDKPKMLKAETFKPQHLLDQYGTMFLCAGCNTLVQLEGFNVQEMAAAMEKKGVKHVPACPVGMGD